MKTFTIGFNEDAYNEAAFAKRVAQHLGTEHTELYVSPQEALNVIPKLPEIYCEPFADSSQIPTFLVARLARQQVTVSLSGDGGDELFGGYTRYFLGARVWGKIGRFPSGLRCAAASALLSEALHLGWDLSRNSAPHPKEQRWPAPGNKIHKGAALLHSQSISALYRQLVSHWPVDVVLGMEEQDTAPMANAAACRRQ